MKTDDLIGMLATKAGPVRAARAGPRLAQATAGGLGGALAVLLLRTRRIILLRTRRILAALRARLVPVLATLRGRGRLGLLHHPFPPVHLPRAAWQSHCLPPAGWGL